MNSTQETIQIGVSRPALTVDDLPSPEKVFNVKKIGYKEIIKFVLGPSMIALGVSIGSGEWLLGPLAFGQYGFLGIGWLITISAILQVLYNIEVARFTIATGEVPTIAFSRTPPGKNLWIPFTLFVIILGWIWGGWASCAGQTLFTVFTGRPNTIEELEIVRLIGIGLMILSMGLYLFGKKISRTMETFNTFAVWFVLLFIFILVVVLVPPKFSMNGLLSALVPSAPPKGMDISLLGAIIGYTGFGSGFNFMLINYYRDHGYGMGHKVGFISGLIGGDCKEILPSGITFKENKNNTIQWKRWWHFLKLDQWGVFFIGALFGMFLPGILVAWLAQIPGAEAPTSINMPIYAATELGRHYGNWLFTLTLLVGSFTLFKTQATLLEMLIRNSTDSFFCMSKKFRDIARGDIRKIYYPMAVLFILIIGVIIHVALPTTLLVISANMANFAAIIFPLVMIYLNRQLPKPARSKWPNNLGLIAVVLFYGFFFTNFIFIQITGNALISF